MRSPTVVLALAVPLITSALSAAQSTSATVSGSVLDEQKAALPGATVAVRNLDSGQSRSTTTDERGTFRLVGLPPGRYEITADLSGFGRLVRSDLVLTVAQEVTLALTLRVAALQEAVTVTGELPLVETTRSALGTTITTTEIEELPIAAAQTSARASLVRSFANLFLHRWIPRTVRRRRSCSRKAAARWRISPAGRA